LVEVVCLVNCVLIFLIRTIGWKTSPDFLLTAYVNFMAP